MFSNYCLREIIKDGYKAVKSDSSIFACFILFLLIPLGIVTATWYFEYKIEKDILSNIIGGIGLFAGLMFTLLFIVANNFKSRKLQVDSDEEEDVEYIERYKVFAENIIAMISLSIIYAGILVVLIVIYSLSIKSYFGNDIYTCASEYLSAIIIVLLSHFMLIIIRILKEMYAMLYDDINK